MNRKYYLLGFFLLGILALNMSVGFTVATEDDEEEPCEEDHEKPGGEEPEKPDEEDHEKPGDEEPEKPDEDHDGIDDDFEDDNKRDICIWFGEHAVEMTSIRRHGDQKDILELRIGYNQHGLAIRVSFGTIIKSDKPEDPVIDIHEESNGDIESSKDSKHTGDTEEEWTEYKLEFEVIFRGLIEYVDLNDNGVFDHEEDHFIEDYGINSFQPIAYTLQPISDNSSLHYFLFNTTDGVFAAHIYFVEEFVYIDETLISPTQIKIDIEITNFNYTNDSSQLALITKLRSEGNYEDREETLDEKEGYANEEKEVFIENGIYTGIFSWKENALVDGIEMPVLTNKLEFDDGNNEWQMLLINYPRGNHIYHDPKIGISIAIGDSQTSLLPFIITGTVISIVGVAVITGVIVKKKRRIIKW